MTCLIFTFVCLLIVTVYWTVSSFGNKPDAYRQGPLTRFLTGTAPIVGYGLIYLPLSVGWLGERFIPEHFLVRFGGALCCVAGLAFASWGRRTLGRNWSGTTAIKEDHELVEAGPYGLVRHPIYAGLLLFVLSAAVVLGEVRGLVALGITAVALAKKIVGEERAMGSQFPDKYPDYRERVKRLVPFIY